MLGEILLLAWSWRRHAVVVGRYAVGGALVILLAAVVVAATAVLTWQQLTAATETGAPALEIKAASATDFSWVTTAMSECDAVATAAPKPLHFLVTPLAMVTADAASWRAKTINHNGDGVLLRADDALDGLKQGALRIYPAEYVFSLTDEASGMAYRWRAARGVARFANADAATISSFMVQFTTWRGAAGMWGTSFNRLDGTCYWVNPVIGG